MAGGLEGKVAAITGASSGIGAATARALAGEGAAVALAARRVDRLQSLADEIESGGGKAVPVEMDVTDESQARAFVERAHSELGGLHILVNNAGLMLLGAVDGADTDEWRRMIEINLLGLLWCTHAAMPLIRDSGGGDIVNISSVAGRRADAGAAVYNMTKWGVTGFSEGLRQEALHSKIRVTCIEPGFVATELQEQNTNPVVLQATEKMREQIGEVLEAEDIADTIRFVVTRPPRVGINEVLVRPRGQSR